MDEDAFDDSPGDRGAPGWRSRVDEVFDATGVASRAVIVGVALVGVVLGSLWWLSRQAPVPVEASLPLVDTSTVTTTTGAPAPVIVHVAGAVTRPGVRRLPAGARVIDAVEASGGLAPDADPDRVNLAAELVDGAQVYVPRVGEAVPPGVTEAGGADGPGTVDVNTADAASLETLPGVGPATAAAIIDHRERHGPFAAVDDLLDVRGIGEVKLAALRDLVRV